MKSYHNYNRLGNLNLLYRLDAVYVSKPTPPRRLAKYILTVFPNLTTADVIDQAKLGGLCFLHKPDEVKAALRELLILLHAIEAKTLCDLLEDA